MKFTIETVSKMTGIPAASLRNWEKRYGFPKPDRTDGGHRFYSDSDIDFLKKAAQMMDEGHNLNQISTLYTPNCCKKIDEQITGAAVTFDDVQFRVNLLHEALLKFDTSVISQQYAILNAKLSPHQMFDLVFETLLQMLKSDEFASVAQLHFGRAFLKTKLAGYLGMDFPASQSARILAASCDENDLEIMLVSAHLKFRGFPIYYLGSDLPSEDFLSVIEDIEPHILLLAYENEKKFMEDAPLLNDLKIPVVVRGIESKMKLAAHVHLCAKRSGLRTAELTEMLCLSSNSSM